MFSYEGFVTQHYSPAGPKGAAAAPQAFGTSMAGGQAPEADADKQIDLRALAMTFWRGRWILVVCILFSGMLGYLTTTQQPPAYRAAAKVMFDTQQANVDAGEAVVGNALARAGALQNQIEILRSTSLIRRVVRKLDLANNPAFNPALRPREPTWHEDVTLPPEIESLLIRAGLWPAPPPPPIELSEAAQAVADARLEQIIIQRIAGGLQLQPIDRSLVIEIGYIHGNPRLATDIVNTVAEQYIVDQLEGKLETFRSATQWLTTRVAELQQRVEAAESAVLQAQAALTEEVGISLEATREQLSALTAARSQARQEASQLRARMTRLSDALDRDVGIGSIPELRDVPAITTLLARQQELRDEDERLSVTLRESHPSRQRLLSDLQDIDMALQREAQEILEGLRLSLELAEERSAELSADMRSLEDQALQLSTDSIEIRNLEREAQASRILYENLLARLQETNAQEDLQSADARILTPAEVPTGPLGTQKQRTFQVALVLGAALGVGIIFLLERLNNTFRSPAQLEQMVGQPVLSTVPMTGRKVKRDQVIAHLKEKPSSSLAESIRNLRTSILFSDVDTPPRIVMFSSSVPREGKSTTSMLMAMTSRQMGKSAIIVDCDLRMPALAKVMKAGDDKPGLLSVINDSATIEDAVYTDPDTKLDILMTRSSERTAKINAADVLSSQKFRNLIKTLSERYDLVVLDTPPTLVVTDARIVSALADAVVFAVRWDSTPRAAVQEGIRELLSVRAPLIGVVMTQVNEQRATRYAYDGYSYYKGRYRDYYEA